MQIIKTIITCVTALVLVTGCTSTTSKSTLNLLDKNNPIDGDIWNHTHTASNEWVGLKRSSNSYDISRNNYKFTLIKKYSDWHQQHSNGFFALNEQTITFAQLDTLVVEIYYDSQLSSIPSQQQIQQHFPGLTQAQYQEWDNGEFVLEIQLHDSSGNYHAALNLTLSAEQADKWLTIEVPIAELEIWRSEGYNKFTTNLAELTDKQFSKVSFVAETLNRKVYRNYAQSNFDLNKTPELFKEIAFRLKRVAITTRS
ncbi:hypothetical protein ACMZOO_10915 [Catenovulum sp. SX2]|uniref:hypothetical protein n=1 Tax=Catenovulum sp. SX2 TaxID=3398614 RepID=UPI003F83950D